MAEQHTSIAQQFVVVLNDAQRNKRGTHFFHFWRRDIYGEPQFGDEAGAKRYANLTGCLARLRALRAIGLDVSYTTSRAAIATTNQEPRS
jgi:hypothetical protein